MFLLLLLHECRRLVVGHLDPGDVGGGLEVDALQLVVLVLQLAVHVVGHVAQVSDHGAHLGVVGESLLYT